MAQKTAKSGQNKFVKVGIIVIAVILALSMTVPAVGTLMNRGNNATEEQAAVQDNALLAVSQGYVDTFADLKAAWRASDNPDTYEETLKINYQQWAEALYNQFATYGATNADEIGQAFQLLIDDIEDTKATSADPASYDTYTAFAYYTYALCLRSWVSVTGEDVHEQLDACTAAGIEAHKAALDYAYDSATAGDLATMYFWDGQTDLAIQTANEALEADPENATVWYNLGNYYSAAEQYDAATEAYTQAAALDADNALGVQEAANSQLDELAAQTAPAEEG